MRHAVRPARKPAPLVAAGLLAGAALVGVLTPAPPGAPPAAVPAGAVARACPSFASATALVRIGAVADDGAAWSPLADPAAATPLDGTSDAPADPVRVVAPAGAAAAATVTVLAPDGADRGLAAVACPSPRVASWFVGVRSGGDWQSEVLLVNLDATDAEAGLTVLGPEGRGSAPGSRGILVPARSARVVPLGPLVDAAGPVSVHVEATSGRVAALVRQRAFAGTEPRGADWVAPAAAAAETVTVAGLPAGPGARTLVVANPSERVALVDIDLLGPGGSYRATGAERVELPPLTTRTVDLSAGLAGQAASVRLTSSQPVTAAVEATGGDDPATADWLVLPAGQSTGRRAVTVLGLPAEVATGLTVANPGTAEANAVVVARGAGGGEPVRWELVLPPGSSVTVDAVSVVDPVWEVTTDSSGLVASVAAAGPTGPVQGVAAVGVAGDVAARSDVVVAWDPRAGA